MGNEILVATLLLFLVLGLFGVAGQLLVALWGLVGGIFRLPATAARWLVSGRARRRKKRNFEVLASYMPVIGDNPRLIYYLEHLIEQGIEPERLQEALHRNAKVAEALDIRRRMREVLVEAEEKAGLADLAARHEAVLAESQARLEHLRFKEKVLGGLFDKIRSKYRV